MSQEIFGMELTIPITDIRASDIMTDVGFRFRLITEWKERSDPVFAQRDMIALIKKMHVKKGMNRGQFISRRMLLHDRCDDRHIPGDDDQYPECLLWLELEVADVPKGMTHYKPGDTIHVELDERGRSFGFLEKCDWTPCR